MTDAKETAADVLADLRTFLNEASITHGLTFAGLRLVDDFFRRTPRAPENPDPMITITDGDPNLSGTRFTAQMRVSEAVTRVAIEGPVEVLLGAQWVAFTFAAWEHFFRRRLAAAHGVDAADILVPVFGDLRHIRHDILHHRGIATAEHAGRCDILNWFSPGNEIRIRGDRIADFMDCIPWAEMANAPR